MKLDDLPILLTATLPMLPDSAPRGALRDVLLAGQQPKRREVNRLIRCQRRKAAGLEGRGHNRASRSCPARAA